MDLYAQADEGGILWSDPAIGIEWPITDPIISDKDNRLPSLSALQPYQFPLCGGCSMNILIAGAKGQLGTELMRQGPEKGFSVFPVDLPEVDITRPDPVRAAIRDAAASLVVNCAAYTQVDMAESQDMLAFKVNSLGPAILAHVCTEAKIPLIHISTDFVFDGSQRTPYLETDPLKMQA